MLAASPLSPSVLVVLLVLSLAWWGAITYFIGFNPRIVRAVPRRPVPWNILDLCVIICILATVLIVAQKAAVQLGVLPARAEQRTNEEEQAEAAPATPQENAAAEKERSPHELIRMLRDRPDLMTILVVAFAAVVVAPITEEFLFRLVLQGYLESLAVEMRVLFRSSMALVRGTVPIVIASLLFASIHARGPDGDPTPVDEVFIRMAIGVGCQIVAMILAIVYLRGVRGANATDLGFSRRHLLGDIGLGLLAFVVVAPPVYGMQESLSSLLPRGVPVDPISLFPFACALGFLYFRTHRITPSIILHMALNATSTTIAIGLILSGADIPDAAPVDDRPAMERALDDDLPRDTQDSETDALPAMGEGRPLHGLSAIPAASRYVDGPGGDSSGGDDGVWRTLGSGISDMPRSLS